MATKRPHWLVQRSANYSITSFVNNKNQLSPYRSYLQQNKHYWICQRQYSAKVMQEYTFIVIEHEENFPLSRWLFPIISSFCTIVLQGKLVKHLMPCLILNLLSHYQIHMFFGIKEFTNTVPTTMCNWCWPNFYA